MKKVLFFSLALLLVAGVAMAADDVANTKHNLTSTGPGTYKLTGVDGTDQVCIFCHTPHLATLTAKPLWNRYTNSTGFTMYNSTWSSTINETVDAAPGSVSLACLSCHDGTIAFDRIYNGPTTALTYDYDATAASRSWTWTGGNSDLSGATVTNLGKVLTNDHPISITYRTVDTAGFYNNPTVVQLYNNKVECGSCHKVHDGSIPAMLRESNASSTLCKRCHIK